MTRARVPAAGRFGLLCLALGLLGCGAEDVAVTSDALGEIDSAAGDASLAGGPVEGHPGVVRSRPEGLLLDGAWDYAADPQDLGLDDGWWRPEAFAPFARQINVPLPPEAPGAFSGSIDVPPGRVHWYRRHFELPSGWRSPRAALVFLGVDWSAQVWLDGVLLGEHHGAYVPFEFDLTSSLHLAPDADGEALAEPHTLVVRTVDDGLDEPAQMLGFQAEGPSISGIWRSIYMEGRGAAWTSPLDVAPRLAEGAVELRFAVRGARDEVEEIELVVNRPEGGADVLRASVRDDPQELSLSLTDARAWDLEDPWVYDGVLRLLAGTDVLDEQRFSFGLREVSTGWCPGGSPEEVAAQNAADADKDDDPEEPEEPPDPEGDDDDDPEDDPDDGLPEPQAFGCVTLNGAALKLRWVTTAGLDPWSLGACGDSSCSEELEAIKDAGFNAVRVRGTVLPPRALATADRIGLLVLAEVPAFAMHAPSPLGGAGAQAFEDALKALVARDRLHPSVISWTLFHEAAGLLHPPFWQDASSKDWISGLVKRARANSPELLFEDNLAGGFSAAFDGSYPHVATDTLGTVASSTTDSDLLAWLQELSLHIFPGSTWGFFGAANQTGEPWLVAGLGCQHDASKRGDISGCLPGLLNTIRSAERVAGFGLASFRDSPLRRDGLQTADGQWKSFGYEILGFGVTELLFEDFVTLSPPLMRQSTPGELIEVEVGVTTDRPGARDGWRLEAEAIFDTCTTSGRAVHETLWERSLELPLALAAGKTAVETVGLSLPEEPGVAGLVLRLIDADGETRAANRLQVVINGECQREDPDERAPDVVLALGSTWQGQWSGGWGDYTPGAMVAGRGSGYFRWEPYKRGQLNSAKATHYALVFEAASCPELWPLPQTDEEAMPSQAWCQIRDGVRKPFTLEDAPADSRGVLSGAFHKDMGWAYGGLIRLDFSPEEAGTPTWNSTIPIECGVDSSAERANGMRVFDQRGGRFPVAAKLLVWEEED